MAKRIQPTRVLLDGKDVSNLVSVADFEIRGGCADTLTLTFVGVDIDVDPQTRQLTVSIDTGAPPADPAAH